VGVSISTADRFTPQIAVPPVIASSATTALSSILT
jgi:hypothetical protein